MSVVEVHQGTSSVVLGLPHTGTDVPDDIKARMNANGLLLADTDWHVHRLYDGLLSNPTTVRATFHRYVIDANRDPAGAAFIPDKIRRVWFHRPILTMSRSGLKALNRAKQILPNG